MAGVKRIKSISASPVRMPASSLTPVAGPRAGGSGRRPRVRIRSIGPGGLPGTLVDKEGDTEIWSVAYSPFMRGRKRYAVVENGRVKYFVSGSSGPGPQIYRPWVNDAWQLVYYYGRRPYWEVVDGKLVPTIRVPRGILNAIMEPGTSIEALRRQLAKWGWYLDIL